jgi:hypothetical protein
MIPDRYFPLKLFNVFMIFLKYGFYIPCKYCISKPYNYCLTIPYNCKRSNEHKCKHNDYHIIQEKCNDLNEKYKQVEISLNSLIEMINENNENINDKFSDLLSSVNIIIEDKLNGIDNKIYILENQGSNKIKKNTSNTCYRGRNVS